MGSWPPCCAGTRRSFPRAGRPGSSGRSLSATSEVMTDTPAVVLERVSKSYGDAGHAVTALSDVSLQVPASQFLSIMGPSGSGKSTLLNLIAGLDTPTHGRVIVGGQELTHLSDDARSDLRLRHIGFVFQSFNLFPTFTAQENVAWPLGFVGLRWRAAKVRAAEVLEQMGVDAAARSRLPPELSGGEQQRVAIARALVTEPRLVLADEPTGNLDSETGRSILGVLLQLNTQRGLTVIMVTHNAFAATYGQRTLELRDGRIVRDVHADSEPSRKGPVPLHR